MARTVQAPALLIGAWLVTAVVVLNGALSYGELAAMMAKAGGQYVYLREGLAVLLVYVLTSLALFRLRISSWLSSSVVYSYATNPNIPGRA